MKRSFQVATIFAGAVATAAALTPAANAAPATTAHNCGSDGFPDSPEVHLYYAANQNHPIAACVSGNGFVDIGTGKQFSGLCGGAWSGSFYYHVPGTNTYGYSSFPKGDSAVRFRQPDSIIWLELRNGTLNGGFCPFEEYWSR